MSRRDDLERACSALVAADADALGALAAPDLRLGGPLAPGTADGSLVPAGARELTAWCAAVAAWAGGPLESTARAIDADTAVLEARAPGGAPLTAVLRVDGGGRLRELRGYVDPRHAVGGDL